MPAMAVIRLREPLKRLASNRAEHELEGATVIDLLRALERTQPSLHGWILDERGVVRPHINVFVNGELAGAETEVGHGDHVDVIPAISGGSND
jgi:molybdopterin converting factor small subunit